MAWTEHSEKVNVILAAAAPHPPSRPASTTGHLRVNALRGLSQPEDPWGAGGACATAAAAPSFRLGPARFFTAPRRGWGPIAQPGGSRGCFHLHLCFRLGASAHQGGAACGWQSWGGCRAAGETVHQPDGPRAPIEEDEEEEEGVTTCIPVPWRAQGARVLQGGGGCLQPQQAKSFCQGCLHQLHLLLLHLKPPAQGLQGLLSRALTWERGKKPSACHTPLPPHTHLGKGLRGFSLPLTLHLSNRTAPCKQLQAWKRSQRGGDSGKRIKGLLLAGQARNLAELPSCCLSQPPQRQGVPWSTRGEIWSSAEERGNHRRRRMRDFRAQPRVTVGLQGRQRNCEGAPGEKRATQRTVILRTQKRRGPE